MRNKYLLTVIIGIFTLVSLTSSVQADMLKVDASANDDKTKIQVVIKGGVAPYKVTLTHGKEPVEVTSKKEKVTLKAEGEGQYIIGVTDSNNKIGYTVITL